MRQLICALIIVLACTPVLGKDKDDKARTFDAPIEKVWEAVVASANENFVIEHSDKDSGILNFHSGISMTSNGFRCGVVVKKNDDGKVRVQLNTQKKAQLFAWGAGGRIADKFFKGVENYLKEGKAKV